MFAPLTPGPIHFLGLPFLQFLHTCAFYLFSTENWPRGKKGGGDPRRGREKGREGKGPLFSRRVGSNLCCGERKASVSGSSPFRQTTPKRGHLLFSAQFRPEICAISAWKKRFWDFLAGDLPGHKIARYETTGRHAESHESHGGFVCVAHESRNGGACWGHPCGSGMPVTL